MNAYPPALVTCRIVGPNKLPTGLDSTRVCATIADGVAAASPGSQASIALQIASPRMIAATAGVADGRILPEQKLTVTDGVLTMASIGRFAASLGATVASFANHH